MFRRIPAHALSDVDVRFVSLVRRGANRIPFRFTKKDESLVDFFKFFHKSEGQAAPPAADEPVPVSVPVPPESPDLEVVARLDALAKSLDALSGLVESRLDAIDVRFEAVEATVRKTEAKVKGAVIGIAYGDPPPASPRADGTRLPPLLDTGMSIFRNPS